MRIAAYDIATVTGWANAIVPTDGSPPEMRSGIERLKKPQDDVDVVAVKMGGMIRDLCFIAADMPHLIVAEAPIMPFQGTEEDKEGRKKPIVRNMVSIILPQRAVGAIQGVAGCYGIRVAVVSANTARVTLIGRKSMGSPEETKAAVLRQCIAWGYLPEGSHQTDVSDAICLWHHAALTWGRYRPTRLVMFPQRKLA